MDNNENKPEMVSVPKEEWDKVTETMAGIPALIESVANLKRDNEVLRAAADRGKVQAIEEKLKRPGNSIVKLRTFRAADGSRKLVVGWAMLRNDSYIDPLTKREVANQVIEIELEDGTKQQMPYNDFSRFTEEKVLAEVVAREGEIYKVKVLGGDDKVLSIDAKFLN